jgi:hypothetical protein
MPQTPSKPPLPAEPASAEVGFITRDAWLHTPVFLSEEVKEIEGLGKVVVSEVTAAVRAELVTLQSSGLLRDENKQIDRAAYEEKLLVAGLVDPSSPEGSRVPLFRKEDMGRVMRWGSGKIEPIVDAIERLSHLGKYSSSAEGNSAKTPSAAGTSG